MNFKTGQISVVANGLVMTDWVPASWEGDYYFVYDGSIPLKQGDTLTNKLVIGPYAQDDLWIGEYNYSGKLL